MLAPTPLSPPPAAQARPSAPADPSALSALSPPPLSPLQPQDRPLLARLFALSENYQALAAELASGSSPCLADSLSRCSASPPDLLDLFSWSTRPDIAAWIAHYRSMTDLQRRTIALDALEKIVKSPDNKLEQRRAASTILRALDGNWSRPRERSSLPRPPSPRDQRGERLS